MPTNKKDAQQVRDIYKEIKKLQTKINENVYELNSAHSSVYRNLQKIVLKYSDYNKLTKDEKDQSKEVLGVSKHILKNIGKQGIFAKVSLGYTKLRVKYSKTLTKEQKAAFKNMIGDELSWLSFFSILKFALFILPLMRKEWPIIEYNWDISIFDILPFKLKLLAL